MDRTLVDGDHASVRLDGFEIARGQLFEIAVIAEDLLRNALGALAVERGELEIGDGGALAAFVEGDGISRHGLPPARIDPDRFVPHTRCASGKNYCRDRSQQNRPEDDARHAETPANSARHQASKHYDTA